MKLNCGYIVCNCLWGHTQAGSLRSARYIFSSRWRSLTLGLGRELWLRRRRRMARRPCYIYLTIYTIYTIYTIEPVLSASATIKVDKGVRVNTFVAISDLLYHSWRATAHNRNREMMVEQGCCIELAVTREWSGFQHEMHDLGGFRDWCRCRVAENRRTRFLLDDVGFEGAFVDSHLLFIKWEHLFWTLWYLKLFEIIYNIPKPATYNYRAILYV